MWWFLVINTIEWISNIRKKYCISRLRRYLDFYLCRPFWYVYVDNLYLFSQSFRDCSFSKDCFVVRVQLYLCCNFIVCLGVATLFWLYSGFFHVFLFISLLISISLSFFLKKSWMQAHQKVFWMNVWTQVANWQESFFVLLFQNLVHFWRKNLHLTYVYDQLNSNCYSSHN